MAPIKTAEITIVAIYCPSKRTNFKTFEHKMAATATPRLVMSQTAIVSTP